ncbi:MAG: adenosine deaminase [Acidobacteria bacterium]|nr:adenosine deaminase [Acidobacteriota bacterium]
MFKRSQQRQLALILNSFLSLILLSVAVHAQTAAAARGATPEQRAATFFESVRKSPPQQFAFLKAMPKGADLHNHLSGAIYAESYIQWAAEKGLCINTTTFVLSQTPCAPNTAGSAQITTALTNAVLYRQIIDAWSMRNWQYSGQSGHDRFFDTFAKFGPATYDQTGRMLAEVTARAARGQVRYLELMLTPDGGKSSQVGQKIGWSGDFQGTLDKLKTEGIAEAVEESLVNLREAEKQKDALLKCGTVQADPGCGVTVRYIFQVGRGAALGSVYAQMTAAFMLASNPQSKVVGLNLVQPEDSLPSMQNFPTQMQMLDFLHNLYPSAHITLHAGELAPGMVPPEGLSFHIRSSVLTGHAERIGHGVGIMHEVNPYELLKELARRNVMVEICLTSNDVILGIKGKDHPLLTYMQYGVPVALATDDEGVARSEISREFLKAAMEQELDYIQLKTMARTSLQFAFVPGASLWSNARSFRPAPQCANDRPGQTASQSCQQFLATSEKARLQWELEKDFREFESRY